MDKGTKIIQCHQCLQVKNQINNKITGIILPVRNHAY